MISWAITAHNEHVELESLLKQINKIKKESDEIIIQLDINYTKEVQEVIEKSQNSFITFNLNKDFASFKNNLKNHCTKEYIFFLDADEMLTEDLSENIHELLELNPHIDCYAFPRVNIVLGIEDRPDLIQKWGWKLDINGFINYPDYQLRLCKNLPTINWENKVHERLNGYKELAMLESEEWALLHSKTLEKQIKQNELYATI